MGEDCPYLNIGDYLWNVQSRAWVRLVDKQYIPGRGQTYTMYDLYVSGASFNYVVNNYLDPPKLGPIPGSLPSAPASTSTSSSSPTSSSPTHSVGYAYNGEVLANITYPNIVVKYTYDLLGRVLNLTQAYTTTYYARSVTYYPDDQLKSVQYGDGLVANYAYNSLGRPSEIKLTGNSIMLQLDYTYNKTGTVATVTGQVNAGNINEQYRYDPLGRLINATIISGSPTTGLWYQYDRVGNRQWQGMKQGTGSWTVTSYSYDVTNNELKSSSGPGGISYSYDGNGNLLTRSVGATYWAYTWNPANRLVGVFRGGAVWGFYAYDGLGRRVETVEASTTFYAYLGTETLSELVSGGATTDYIYAAGLRIAKTTGTTISYYHTDALGSTRLVMDSKQAVLFSDNYQPFGQDNAMSGFDTYRFTGKLYNQGLGLYYEYQRWYDPSIGRFISQDPLLGAASDPQSMNPYVYVENSPVNNVDPTGKFLVEALFGAGIGAGIGCFGCVWATGGWTSSTCGEAALAGAAIGALAGLTYGASLAFAGGTLGLGTATASGGFVFSGVSGAAAFAFAGATSGAVAGGAQYLASGGINHFNAQDFAESAGWGALFGAATSVAAYGVGKAIGQFLLQPKTIGGELELRGPPGYTRSVGDQGLKGIGIYDNSGRITSRIDVFGREHYGIETPHTSDYSWTWSAKAPADGWWATKLRPTPASPLDKLLIFLLS